MTIKTSGDLSISDIVTEFGGSTPHSLSEYYAGGSVVYSGAKGYPGGVETSIPSSGEISISNFYGASKRTTLYISSDQTDLNLRTWAVSNGWNEADQLEVVVNSGVYILGSTSSASALTVSGSFPAGVRLVNSGYIIGHGGNGGDGGSGAPNAGTAGTAGGTAITVSANLTIVNNSTIAGGGGGGGGGGGSNYSDWYGGGGGGGGAGGASPYATGGAGGLSTGPGEGTSGSGGTATLSTAGSGGASQYAVGGAGGGWGTAGSNGTSSAQRSGGSGGAAGKYVNGNSYVTWETTGTRLGNVA